MSVIAKATRYGLAVLMTASAYAAGAQGMAGDPEELRLYSGIAPGSEGGEHAPEINDGRRVRNVSTPTLTVFRPPATRASDVVIIVLPGGGFEHLSMVNEGSAVARRLAEQGITAILLKYRLNETVSSNRTASPQATRPAEPDDPPALARRTDERNSSPGARLAMQDGANAVRFVRSHADAWGISPRHVGVLGFSAGAVVALHVALSPDPEIRPDFAAAIYGTLPPGASIPATLPPLFLAVAGDDTVIGPAGSMPIFEAWRAARQDIELHVFQSGGHGFGMEQQHKTSDHWIDDYLWWLEARGLLTPSSLR